MLPEDDTPFRFTRPERQGLIILLILLVVALVCWRLIPQWIHPPEPPDRQLQLAWKTFRNKNLRSTTAKGKTNDRRAPVPPKGKHKVTLVPFDPNQADQATLLALGLPPGTVQTLIHYREKGGRFYKKEDLKKLYTLSKKDYRRIAPYVQIQQSTTGYRKQSGAPGYSATPDRPTRHSIDLNTAEAATLIALPGIGPTFAKRIIAYRTLLGGFVSVNQLREVYGFPDSTFRQLKNYFSIDTSEIRKISVNTASEEQLARHPYISRRLAKNILLLRKGLKKYKNIDQLKQVPLINAEKYRKIAPYLTL